MYASAYIFVDAPNSNSTFCEIFQKSNTYQRSIASTNDGPILVKCATDPNDPLQSILGVNNVSLTDASLQVFGMPLESEEDGYEIVRSLAAQNRVWFVFSFIRFFVYVTSQFLQVSRALGETMDEIRQRGWSARPPFGCSIEGKST